MCRANLRSALLFLVLIPYLISCRKDITSVKTLSTTNNPAKDGPIPPYIFNWETATTMPSAPSGTVNPVPMPWNSGTTAIDANLAPDYKSADGWKLVYNTFSPTTILGDPNYTYFFTLYNVYRGLLRFYLWQPASTAATSYVNHGLSNYTTGVTSPMLDFNGQEIVNTSTNQTKFANVLYQQINSAQGTWFVFQYEMTYDPNIANLSFPAFGLEWTSQWVNVTQINLNGSLVGSINGYLGDPNASSFSFGSVIGTGVTTFLGGLNYTAMLNQLTSNPNAKTNASDNPYSKALGNGLGSIVKGFFNGILGGSSAPTTAVNLTINTTIKLSGSAVSNGGMEDIKLVMPGEANSQTANGNTPAFNSIMGIFNISNTPIVDFFTNPYSITVQDPQSGGDETMSYNGVNLEVDPTSFHINWNPAIINSSSTGATIQNLHIQTASLSSFEFLGTNGTGIGVNEVVSGPNPLLQDGTGTIEEIGNYSVALSDDDSPLEIYYDQWDFSNSAVRISFDVVPNNGGKKCTIVKTFRANLVFKYF